MLIQQFIRIILMSKQVKCSQCLEMKWMRDKFLKRNFSYFNANNLEELDHKYVCWKCRKIDNKIYKKRLCDTDRFKEIQNLLQIEVNSVLERGFNEPKVMANFANNVKAILDKEHIKVYHPVTAPNNNKDLKGIMVYDIPFYGNVLIGLNSRGKINGR